MGSTPKYGIYYDDPQMIAKGRTQDQLQATSIESALSGLDGKIAAIKPWVTGRLYPATTPDIGEAPLGFSEVWTASDASAYGLPTSTTGVVESFVIGNVKYQRWMTSGPDGMQTWARMKAASGWQPWKRLDGVVPWSNGRLYPASTPDIGEAPQGYSEVWTASDASAYGLPTSTTGVVESFNIGVHRYQRWMTHTTGGMQMWMRKGQAGGDFEPWQQISAGAASGGSAGQAPIPGSYKTAGIPISLGFGGSTATGEGYIRAPLTLPSKVTKFRIRIGNFNPRFEATASGPMALTKVSWGIASGTNSTQWNTIAETASTQGMTPWVSPWVEVPADAAGKEILIAYGWQAADTVQNCIGRAYSGKVPGEIHTGTAYVQNHTAGFVAVEVEVPADKPVIAVFGDSISSGAAATATLKDSWLQVLARKYDAVGTHFSHSGDVAHHWQDPESIKWDLYGKETSLATACFYFMGNNDIFGSTRTLEEIIRETEIAVQNLRRRVSPTIIGCTITPRTSVTGERENIRRQFNQWMKSSPLFRGVIDMAAVVSDDDEILKPAYDADQVHMNTAGYLAMANAVDLARYIPGLGVTDVAKPIKIDSWFTVPLNYRSGLVASGNTVQLTLNGQAGASGFTGKIGTIPAEYRPKVEAYEMGQSIGGSGVHVLTNGDVVAPTVAGGAYFKATLVWVI